MMIHCGEARVTLATYLNGVDISLDTMKNFSILLLRQIGPLAVRGNRQAGRRTIATFQAFRQ
eukprot:4557888-Pyramimonas_sp.AAC.1